MKSQLRNRLNWKRHSRSFLAIKQKRRTAKLERLQCKKRRRRVSFSSTSKGVSRRAQEISNMFPGYKLINAPMNFSLLNNEADALRFLRKLQECFHQQKKVAVLLDNVRVITTDAILVLLSNMVQFKAARIGFNGTRPKDSIVAAKLDASGFFNHLYGRAMRVQDTYSFRRMNNFIYTHGQKTVEAKIADELVKYASETVWGVPRRCPGIQTTLVELMHNTHDHAGSSKGEKHWWLSVEHDEQAHEVTFSFIDFGVGIFRSLSNKQPGEPLYGAMDYIVQHFPMVTTEIGQLKLILEGKVVLTQFNEYYRGKGLRKIYQKQQNNQISDLTLISNYASVHAANNDFHAIKNEFMGTFISFKMNSKTLNLQWAI